jgi:hypothetical protein
MADEMEKISGKRPSILLANTEQKRGYYYANEFTYDIVDIDAPHEPEKYVELIDFAINEGYGILIIDSTSHEWEGRGGCLEINQRLGGNFQSWAKVTPRHDKFINAIADSPIHVIATMRGKDQYVMSQQEGKDGGKQSTKVEKVGVGAKQRDGFEYEFTCTFLLDQKTNTAEVFKDNTHLFENEAAVKLTEDHGRKIIKWANSGAGYTPPSRSAKETDKPAAELSEARKSVIAAAKKKGGSKDPAVMETMKKYVESGNPNSITDIEVLKNLLADLEALEVSE